MGLFNTSSPFDADVEKATNENNTSEDWGLIMEICDKVGTSSTNAKDCLRSILKRLQNQDPHIVLQAITLLDACVNNCGKVFQLEVASREFEGELRKLLLVRNTSTANQKVVEKLRGIVKKWAEGDFKNDPQLGLIPSLYHKLRQEGIDFNVLPSNTPKTEVINTDPDAVSSQQEVDDIAKAIELSLKENQSPIRKETSLYPSVSGMAAAAATSVTPSKPQTKVRALYDFEAVEDNELTFFAGEIIHLIDDSDANWWKGSNQRGEGLFPANFVTTDLTPKVDKKTVQFNEIVEVKKISKAPELVQIDEAKIDRVLNLLHEADPNDGQNDSEEMISLEEEVYKMGPLIDAELEKLDRKSSELGVVGASLVDALNMYHSLMHEMPPHFHKPQMPPPPQPIFHPPPPPQAMYNGVGGFVAGYPGGPTPPTFPSPGPMSAPMGPPMQPPQPNLPDNPQSLPHNGGLYNSPPGNTGPPSTSPAHQQQYIPHQQP